MFTANYGMFTGCLRVSQNQVFMKYGFFMGFLWEEYGFCWEEYGFWWEEYGMSLVLITILPTKMVQNIKIAVTIQK